MKIEIRKTRAKQPFRVRYIAQNGEVIAVSENLSTRDDAIVNIKAMAALFNNQSAIFWDYTKSKEPVRIGI